MLAHWLCPSAPPCAGGIPTHRRLQRFQSDRDHVRTVDRSPCPRWRWPHRADGAGASAGAGRCRSGGLDGVTVAARPSAAAGCQRCRTPHARPGGGAPLECRQVVREPGRLLLAWDLSARRVTSDCIVVTVRDATEAETLRAALAASERALEEVRRELREQTEVFNTMESLARTGHWRRIEDPGETVLLWSPGLCDIAGFEQQEWVDPERAVSGILPEDRHVFDKARMPGAGLDVEYRWRRPDGEVRWMRSRVQRTLPRDGVQVVMGVVQDVTDEHRAAEQLREQLLFIQRIASRIPGFIYEYRLHADGGTSVQYISDAVRDFMGVEPSQV